MDCIANKYFFFNSTRFNFIVGVKNPFSGVQGVASRVTKEITMVGNEQVRKT